MQTSLQSPLKSPLAFHAAVTRSRSPQINKHPGYRAQGPDGGGEALRFGDAAASSASADDPALIAFPIALPRTQVLLPRDFRGEIRVPVIHPRLQAALRQEKAPRFPGSPSYPLRNPPTFQQPALIYWVSAFKVEGSGDSPLPSLEEASLIGGREQSSARPSRGGWVTDTGRDVQAEPLPVAKQSTLGALGKAEVV